MLAGTVHEEDLEFLDYPVMVSPKLDGIRCLIHPDLGPVTRSFKPVPNQYIYERLNNECLGLNLDGELIAVDDKGVALTFNETQSAVMTQGGRPSFVYAVFDCFTIPEYDFADRFGAANATVNMVGRPFVEMVKHVIIKDTEEFLAYAEETAGLGFEGTMIRDPNGPYKSGRSTKKQGWLLKYKEWLDAEGSIIGFEERMHNANDDIKDNFGHAKRTSHKENMVPMGTLGALILATEWGQLNVGTGFDDSLRQELWDRNMVKDLGDSDMGHRWIVRGPQPDLGRKVTFKYFPFGMKDLPRHPSFLHFREEE